MVSDFKRAMKLMWGNKRIRASFGLGFGFKFTECGWILALLVLCGLVPIGAKLFGVTLSDRVKMIFLGSSAVLCCAIMLTFTQRMFAQYGRLGKCFGSFPVAKYVMTKGYFWNTWILWSGCFLITVLLHGMCVAAGASESRFEVLLFFFGWAFLINGLGCGLRRKNNPEDDVFMTIGCTVPLAWIVNSVGDMVEEGRVPEKAVLWFVVFMLAGNALVYYFAKKRYQERNTIALTVWPEEKN